MAHHILGDKKKKFQKINAKAFLVKFLNVRNEEGMLDNLMEKAGTFQRKDKAGLSCVSGAMDVTICTVKL